jgi:hypothetical protein
LPKMHNRAEADRALGCGVEGKNCEKEIRCSHAPELAAANDGKRGDANRQFARNLPQRCGSRERRKIYHKDRSRNSASSSPLDPPAREEKLCIARLCSGDKFGSCQR